MNIKDIELRKRFVSDFNLPIPVIDNGYFEYFLDLYEERFETRTKYNNVLNHIKHDFNDNVSMFLEHYGNTRNKIIESISESAAYKKFITCDMNIYNNDTVTAPSKDIYKQTNKNRKFLSIDLSKANFQALRFAGVINKKSYFDFMSDYTNSDYIINSKYTRQVIFGKLNPSRQIKIEKYIISKIYSFLEDFMTSKKIEYTLEVLAVDELIISIPEFLSEEHMFELCFFISDTFSEIYNFDIDAQVDQFELDVKTFKTYNDIHVNAYIKKLVGGDNVIKGVSCNMYAQVFKLLNDLEICDNDMVFYQDKQLSKYIIPLTNL